MRAALILQGLPDEHGPAREKAIFDLVRGGFFLPISWFMLKVSSGGHELELFVSSDSLRFGEADDWIRLPVSARTAQMIADALESTLPTEKIADLVYANASVKLEPHTQAASASMDNLTASISYHHLVETERGQREGLIATVGKEWILSNALVGHPLGAHGAVNYGWHTKHAPGPNGPFIARAGVTVWQTKGTRHTDDHTDYSQVVPRLVQRRVTLDGKEMMIEEILSNPSLASMLNYDGVLRVLRYASAPMPLPPPTDPPPTPTNPVIHFPSPPPMPNLPIPFVRAKNFTLANRTKVDLVVVHTMENPEKPTGAESVASWFASAAAPQASAHYCVDTDSTVQCVKETDIAWAAPGANANGIHIEHCGYARQTAVEWMDPYSVSELERSARLCAEICARWKIPTEFVDAEGLLAGKRGITTHWEITKAGLLAKKRGLVSGMSKNNHTDPGVNFPMASYVDLVQANAHP